MQSVGIGSLALSQFWDSKCAIFDQVGRGPSKFDSHLCHIDLLLEPGFAAVALGIQNRHNSNIEFSIQKKPVVQSTYPDIGLSSGATVSSKQ